MAETKYTWKERRNAFILRKYGSWDAYWEYRKDHPKRTKPRWAPKEVWEYWEALEKQYPLGEIDARCSRGHTAGGKCSACLKRALAYWQVDVKAYYAVVATQRKRLAAVRRRRIYGMVPAEYEAMLVKQRGRCAICRRPERVDICGVIKALSVDHSHTTGAVRALLCGTCNTTLGMNEKLGLVWMKKMVRYLKKHMSEAEWQVFMQEDATKKTGE